MNMEDAVNSFNEQWDEFGAAHLKSFIVDLPDWKDIIGLLNLETRVDKWSRMRPSPDWEISYKNLLAVKKIEYDADDQPNVESDATFFFSLFFSSKELHLKLSESLQNQISNMNKRFSIDTDYNSVKISLSPKYVPYESHKWHTCVIQLQGINIWSLRDVGAQFEKTYLLEPGDCLFFKEGVEHKLSNDEARSSLVGRFAFKEGGNKNA
jgi:hypothetical protein